MQRIRFLPREEAICYLIHSSLRIHIFDNYTHRETSGDRQKSMIAGVCEVESQPGLGKVWGKFWFSFSSIREGKFSRRGVQVGAQNSSHCCVYGDETNSISFKVESPRALKLVTGQ